MAFSALGSSVVIVTVGRGFVLVGDFGLAGLHFGDAWRGFGVDLRVCEIALGECFGDVFEVHADVVAAGAVSEG